VHIRMYNFVSDLSISAHHVQAPEFSPLLIHPDHHEMLYIIEGKVQLNSIDHRYEVTGPALILIPLNTFHQLIHISKQYSYAYWELKDNAHTSFPQPHQCMIWNNLQCSSVQKPPLIDNLFQRMNALVALLSADWVQQHPDIIHEMAHSDLATILSLTRHVLSSYDKLGDNIPAPTNKRIASTKETVEMLVRWMEESYWDNITLQTLAERVHFNSSYLVRMFRRYQGETPFQFLNRLRMKAAISYLANSNLTVEEISYTIGYQSIHYFSRLFKQTYGKSPSQWRIEHKIPSS
jgi:YesN/AraC family two-component response regulator